MKVLDSVKNFFESSYAKLQECVNKPFEVALSIFDRLIAPLNLSTPQLDSLRKRVSDASAKAKQLYASIFKPRINPAINHAKNVIPEASDNIKQMLGDLKKKIFNPSYSKFMSELRSKNNETDSV